MGRLTAREKEVYIFIVAYHESHGYSPSMRDICRGCYLASLSSASHYVQRLLEKGYINYTPRTPRSIVVKETAG